MAEDRVFELRDYLLKPGQRETLITLFEREFIETQDAVGAHVRAIFRDVDRPDHFVWMRSFADMAARKSALEAFYFGPVWQTHRDAANATMIDSDDVHLLDFAHGAFPKKLDAAFIIAEIYAEADAEAVLAAAPRATDVVAVFVTETAANDFPRLPVHKEKVAVTLRTLAHYGRPEPLLRVAPQKTLRLKPTTRSPLQLSAPTQTPNDFDFLLGEWRVANTKLKTRLAGAADWDRFEAQCRFWKLLDGVANVDEFDASARGFKGMSVRALDETTGVWVITWTDSRTGAMTPPVRGGFVGAHGEFVGEDVEGPKAVLCRFRWTRGTSPRWEQAFSIDGGLNWETNWIMEFSRA